MAPANGYSTVSQNPEPGGVFHPGSTDQETDALVAKDTAPAFSSRLRQWMGADVSNGGGDLVLLLCYVITGLLDSSAIFIWGSFVSMQTGNTIYLGLGLVEPTASTRWAKSLISIAAFCLGSRCFSFFHRVFSPRRRWVLVASFAAQMALILVAAAIVTVATERQNQNDLPWHVVLPVALLSFQSSGQAVASRALEYNSLTTVVLTSIYCDLFSDPALFTAGLMHNPERNRRAAALLLLLAGAILGRVFVNESSVGLAWALWTAAALKLLIVLAWLRWNHEPDAEEDNEA